MNAIQAQPAVKPAVVILFDSAAGRTPKPFGKGLLRATGPAFIADYNPADAAWWAEESDRLERERARAELDAEVEAMAQDAAAFEAYMADAFYGADRWEAGELAEAGSAVGHAA